MPFNPKPEYTILPKNIEIRDFFEYKEDFVTRPPYQRKSVWARNKKQNLMDSLFRRYYIPKLVIREVRLSNDKIMKEIIDGQQRITAVQEFFEGKYPLPKSLADINKKLPGSYYKDLKDIDIDIKKFVDKELEYQADIIKNIDDPDCVEHQVIATKIFRRLQEGESLNPMEVAHAQLSSLTRNFIVKYADDQTFDYEKYKPVDGNPDLHKFFSLLNVSNKRMKHLQLMARFVLIERGDGYAELSDTQIDAFIDDAMQDDGIGNFSFENEKVAKDTLKVLNVFYSIFKDDRMLDSESGLQELSIEYFIISIYLLIRHVNKHYVIDDDSKAIMRKFVIDFHIRWKKVDKTKVTEDTDLLTFSNKRQHGEKNLEDRDSILRHIFFEYLKNNDKKIIEKDSKRAFSELERTEIYRRDNGLCQQCLREGKPEEKAAVSWSKYQADHVIPHSKGGQTIVENAELLCQTCNLSKGAS